MYQEKIMKTLTVQELYPKWKNHSVLLIDVRESSEYRVEHIPGSVLIPLSEFSLQKLPSFDKPIVFQCRSGVRSLDACARILEEQPHLEVYSLDGGILAWKKAGYDVTT
jgi:rhodanese-related sulfurtransferase